MLCSPAEKDVIEPDVLSEPINFSAGFLDPDPGISSEIRLLHRELTGAVLVMFGARFSFSIGRISGLVH